jgi:hypothetical protein
MRSSKGVRSQSRHRFFLQATGVPSVVGQTGAGATWSPEPFSGAGTLSGDVATENSKNIRTVTMAGGEASKLLTCRGWGLSLPSDATIVNLSIYMIIFSSGQATRTSRFVFAADLDAMTGLHEATPNSNPWPKVPFGPTFHVYTIPSGGGGNFEGSGLTPSLLESSAWGIGLEVECPTGEVDGMAMIDLLYAEVAYERFI